MRDFKRTGNFFNTSVTIFNILKKFLQNRINIQHLNKITKNQKNVQFLFLFLLVYIIEIIHCTYSVHSVHRRITFS